MDFLKGKENNKTAKVFKAGNSDGMSITFKKMPEVSEDVKKEVSEILNEDADLIQALKDL